MTHRYKNFPFLPVIISQKNTTFALGNVHSTTYKSSNIHLQLVNANLNLDLANNQSWIIAQNPFMIGENGLRISNSK